MKEEKEKEEEEEEEQEEKKEYFSHFPQFRNLQSLMNQKQIHFHNSRFQKFYASNVNCYPTPPKKIKIKNLCHSKHVAST